MLLRTLLLCLLTPALALAQSLRFTTLDIGQGDSAVLITPSGCVALFDGGPTGSGATIKAYLRSLGVTHVDMAFVSHLHADHMGGLDEVEQGTDALPITAVYDHGGTYSSTAYTQYDTQFQGRRVAVTQGQTFSLCSEVTLKVVSSNGNGQAVTDENARSVAVKISYGAFDALVGGDLTEDIESTIGSGVGEVELYKVHHHGSKYSSNSTFLSATKPLVSFISVGMGNTYGHPTLECLSRLAAVGSDVWQTEDPAANVKLGHIALTSDTGASFTVSQGDTSIVYTSKDAPGGDTQAPSAPGSLVASAASTSAVDLSWSASTDDVGVTGYRVYRSADGGGFSLAGTSTTPGFSDGGLSAGATYWYQVTALDAAGNESAASDTVSVTTASPTASVTVTRPNGGESWAAGSSQSITWTSSALSNVKLEYSADNGATWSLIASGVSASAGSYTWVVPATATTTARVRVSDAVAGEPSDVSNAPFSVTASAAKVILNEMLANENGSDTNTEFVELVNVGSTAIDIGGWTISDDTGVRHTFATGTRLAAGKSITVFGGASGIPVGLGNAVAASSGALSLNNTGDTVSLKDARKRSVDAFTYTGSLAGTDGVSMNRGPDTAAGAAFVPHTSLSLLSASPGTRANGGAF